MSVSMSSSNATVAINFEADPTYASVNHILKRDYVGSWADASAEYARIRHGVVWGKLRTLFASKCTPTNKEQAEKLVAELESLCSEICDTQATSKTSHAAAAAALKTWMPPPPSSSSKKPMKNTFAALAEDSEEDEA